MIYMLSAARPAHRSFGDRLFAGIRVLEESRKNKGKLRRRQEMESNIFVSF